MRPRPHDEKDLGHSGVIEWDRMRLVLRGGWGACSCLKLWMYIFHLLLPSTCTGKCLWRGQWEFTFRTQVPSFLESPPPGAQCPEAWLWFPTQAYTLEHVLNLLPVSLTSLPVSGEFLFCQRMTFITKQGDKLNAKTGINDGEMCYLLEAFVF